MGGLAGLALLVLLVILFLRWRNAEEPEPAKKEEEVLKVDKGKGAAVSTSEVSQEGGSGRNSAIAGSNKSGSGKKVRVVG